MHLPWRLVEVEGVHIDTSLTCDESEQLIQMARGRSVLEVGTAYGYSACVMGRVADSVLSVDPHGGYGSVNHSLVVAVTNVCELDLQDRVQLVIGDSKTFLPKLYKAGARFDMAFIDGDHRMSGVLCDLENAWRLLKADGAIAVHDYGEESCPDVARAVDIFFAGHSPHGLIDTLWMAGR